MRPGDSVEVSGRLVNGSDRQVDFDVKVVPVDVQDEGAVTAAEGRDEPMIRNVTTPAARVAVGPMASAVIPLRVSLPADAAPDIYFVGLLVTPAPVINGGVQTVNRILSPIAIDVVGQRDYSVELSHKVSKRVSFGGGIEGTYSVYNRRAGTSIGRSVSVDHLFGGPTQVPIGPGKTNATGDPMSKETVPRLRRKTFDYEWKPSAVIDIAYPVVEISYTGNDGKTEVVRNKGPFVVVISPVVLAGLVVVSGAVGLLAARKLKDRRSGPPVPGA